jgi:hypothetical protein
MEDLCFTANVGTASPLRGTSIPNSAHSIFSGVPAVNHAIIKLPLIVVDSRSQNLHVITGTRNLEEELVLISEASATSLTIHLNHTRLTISTYLASNSSCFPTDAMTTNVAILGATGQNGSSIVNGLLTSGNFVSF